MQYSLLLFWKIYLRSYFSLICFFTPFLIVPSGAGEEGGARDRDRCAHVRGRVRARENSRDHCVRAREIEIKLGVDWVGRVDFQLHHNCTRLAF